MPSTWYSASHIVIFTLICLSRLIFDKTKLTLRVIYYFLKPLPKIKQVSDVFDIKFPQEIDQGGMRQEERSNEDL